MLDLVSKMEKIVSNPGFQHLAEKVFLNLDVEDLKICGQTNQSCKQMLEKPLFWLTNFRCLSKESKKNWVEIIRSVMNSDYEKIITSYFKWILSKEVGVMDLPCFWFQKFRRLSEKHQNDWIKVNESEKNSEKEKAIMSYLQWNLKKEGLVDLPCYTSPAVQDDFRKIIREICAKIEVSDEGPEMVGLLAPLTDNPNAPDEKGWTPIYSAAFFGLTKIVQILSKLTDNPNAPNNSGWTPIHWAAAHGHTDIVKILAPLADNPNAPNNYGATPIHNAADSGNAEIVKILIPLTDNPNAPDKFGTTPIHVAARWSHEGWSHFSSQGYSEIVKILVPLTDNPNAPDNKGIIPSSVTKNDEIRKILESFNTTGNFKA